MKEAADIVQYCQKKHLSLGFAESCTGGGLAFEIASIPGASLCFKGAIVSYQDAVKNTLLGVPSKSLVHPGAVSAGVAEAMLKGVFKQLSPSIGVAITGFAGPGGGTLAAPIGTVFLAIGTPQAPAQLTHLNLLGSRADIIQQTIHIALNKLLQFLKENF